MSKKIFLNICIQDLKRSIAFYEAIGFTQDPMFQSDTAVCMTLSSCAVINVMLITPDQFRDFCPPHKTVADANTTEILMCLSADRKEEVDEILETVVRAGGKADPSKLPQPEGMYGRSFEDPDGHVWEIGYMDMALLQEKGVQMSA